MFRKSLGGRNLSDERLVKPEIEPEGEMIVLQVDFPGAAADTPLSHANQLIVQHHNEEFFLTFFSVSLPVIWGEREERLQQIQTHRMIRPTCVAKLVLTPAMM